MDGKDLITYIGGVILTGLSALTVFFLRRLITENDEQHKSFSKSIQELKDKKSEAIFPVGVSESLSKLEKLSIDLARSLSVQSQKTQSDVGEVKSDILILDGQLKRLQSSLAEVKEEQKLSHASLTSQLIPFSKENINRISDINKKLVDHDRVLDGASKLLRAFSEEISKLKRRIGE